MAWVYRHPVLVWAVAWAVSGTALMLAGVFDVPRTKSIVPVLIVGPLAWAAAGAATFGPDHALRSAAVWAAGFLLVLWLGAIWGAWFERNTVFGVSSAGFIGALLGWAAGAATATFASVLSTSSRAGARAVAAALAWAVAFFVAGFLTLIVGLIAGQLTAAALAFLLSEEVALSTGLALGCGLGGLLAAAAGTRVLRWLSVPSNGPLPAIDTAR